MTFSADEARLAKILPGARCKMQPGPRTVQIAVAMPTSQDKSDHPPAVLVQREAEAGGGRRRRNSALWAGIFKA